MPDTKLGLTLEPLDVLFFRSGRPFDAASRHESGLPLPQTLTGAVRSALMIAHEVEFSELRRLTWQQVTSKLEQKGLGWIAHTKVRGPWPARRSEQGLDVLVPAPSILHRAKKDESAKTLFRLRPRPSTPPGWQNDDGLSPLWADYGEDTEPVRGYLTAQGQEDFLKNQDVRVEDVIEPDQLFGMDHRVGIEIEAGKFTTKEGALYGAGFLALKDRWTARELHEVEDRDVPPQVILYAELVTPESERVEAALRANRSLSFGGEGKRALAEIIPKHAWPEAKAPGKPLLLMTTPGLFQSRAIPQCLQGELTSAAVPGSLPVSGWDLARGGPKKTRFAAMAGSTYFLNDHHALPETLSDQQEDRDQGWGCYLKGTWNDG